VLIRHDTERIGDPILRNRNKMPILVDIHFLSRHPLESQIHRFIRGGLGGETRELFPVGWNFTSLPVRDCCKIIINNDVILGGDSHGFRVENQGYASSVERGVPELDSNSQPWFPFWRTGSTCWLQAMVQNINRTEKGIKVLDWYSLKINPIHRQCRKVAFIIHV
jgi:hypothetical protein